MTHTPTPWIENGWSIDASDGTCICEGFEDGNQEHADCRARIRAATNFFHGKDIPTERIEEGLFWRIVPVLVSAANLGHIEARELLAKLGVES